MMHRWLASALGLLLCGLAALHVNAQSNLLPLLGTTVGRVSSTPPAPTTTWDPAKDLGAVALSNGNLTGTGVNFGVWSNVLSCDGYSTGKYYWEQLYIAVNSGDQTFSGFSIASPNMFAPVGAVTDGVGVGLWTGSVYLGGSIIATVDTGGISNTVAFAIDITSKLLWYRIIGSGSWNATSADPAAGTGGIDISGVDSGALFARYTAGFGNSIDQATANFGATTFLGTKPSGFNSFLGTPC